MKYLIVLFKLQIFKLYLYFKDFLYIVVSYKLCPKVLPHSQVNRKRFANRLERTTCEKNRFKRHHSVAVLRGCCGSAADMETLARHRN